MKRALITGVNGQDGTYLAGLLMAKGYRVVGGVRDAKNSRGGMHSVLLDGVELIEFDMRTQASMADVISVWRPTEVYNCAGYSSGTGMFDDPVMVSEVNGLAVLRILEAIRTVDIKVRFCQASSREVFGEARLSPQDESTPTNPRSPYGAAKQYADSMIRIYRQRYGLFACSAILYNHESPRRGLGFVTRKITHAAASIKLGLANELHLGDLDSSRDWGFAGDFVRAMWLMLQHRAADDYVVATGEIHSVREFCECAFGYLGLDYRNYIREDSSAR